jgi:hypothetical protein
LSNYLLSSLLLFSFNSQHIIFIIQQQSIPLPTVIVLTFIQTIIPLIKTMIRDIVSSNTILGSSPSDK